MQPIAIVPRGIAIPPEELALVATAIQIQLVRDFYPVWGISAVCAAYPSTAAVPPGYWFVFVVPNAQGKAGFHVGDDPDLPPVAFVEHRSQGAWSIAASHEILEMLADPRGDRLIQGPDPLDSTGFVDFLAEICDPCQHEILAYQVDHQHSVRVSDFCLPSFYAQGNAGPPYSLRNSISRPLMVASGGVLSWRNSDANWFQLQAIGGPTRVVSLSKEDLQGSTMQARNFRGTIDRMSGRYAGPPTGGSKSIGQRKYAGIQKIATRSTARQTKMLEKLLNELHL